MVGTICWQPQSIQTLSLLLAVVVVTGCDPVSTQQPADSYSTIFRSETVLSQEPTIISLSGLTRLRPRSAFDDNLSAFGSPGYRFEQVDQPVVIVKLQSQIANENEILFLDWCTR